MTGRPDSSSVAAFVARVSRRLDVMSAPPAAATRLGLAAVAVVVGWPSRTPTGLMVGAAFAFVGVVVGVLVARARRTSVALLVERQAPQCRNVVVTAGELAQHRVSDHVAALVYEHA